MISDSLLTMDQVAPVLMQKVLPLSAARIFFVGFVLPEEFGESDMLQFGNLNRLAGIGLAANAVAMEKAFVQKTIEELFGGELGPFVPETTRFCIAQEDANTFSVTAV